MPHARACNLLNREQLQKMKSLQCHPKFRIRTTYSMKLADDAKEKINHKQVYEKLLAGEWFMAEASSKTVVVKIYDRDGDRGPRDRDQ